MGHDLGMINICAICGKHHTHEDDSDGGYKLGALFFTHPTSSRFRFSTLPFTTLSHKLTFVYTKYSHSALAAAFATVAPAIPTPGTSTDVTNVLRCLTSGNFARRLITQERTIVQ